MRRYTADSLEAPGRTFQVTDVTRTHNQVWLRSEQGLDVGIPYRLEVHFPGVEYYCGPFAMPGLSLRRAGPAERARLSARHGVPVEPGLGLYLLSREHDWFIVSGSPSWAEADVDYKA